MVSGQIGLEAAIELGLIRKLEEKVMKNTDAIYEFIKNATEPVVMKQLQDALEMKPGILSGSLVSLVKSGRLAREKIERISGNGPKMQWAYKVVAETQQG